MLSGPWPDVPQRAHVLGDSVVTQQTTAQVVVSEFWIENIAVT